MDIKSNLLHWIEKKEIGFPVYRGIQCWVKNLIFLSDLKKESVLSMIPREVFYFLKDSHVKYYRGIIKSSKLFLLEVDISFNVFTFHTWKINLIN